PRAAPAFPTRRSSDLVERFGRHGWGNSLIDAVVLDLPQKVARMATAHWPARAAEMLFNQVRHGVVVIDDLHRLGDALENVAELLDRKSTRLNSSHVKI